MRNEIIKLFNTLIKSKAPWQVWSDLIYLYAVELSNQFDRGERKEERNRAYTEKVKNYTEQEQDTIAEIFAYIIKELANNPEQDLLGSLYMEMGLGNDKGGQFFTPYNACELMARTMPIDEVKKSVKGKGYIRANDPTCGGGATLIAVANALRKNGINFQKQCYFIGQDIETTTCLMCYIQLSLLGCLGHVKIKDTLAPQEKADIRKDKNIWVMPMTYLKEVNPDYD